VRTGLWPDSNNSEDSQWKLLLRTRHQSKVGLAAVLERQRWADAPVNDGLFVRRPGGGALTGFAHGDRGAGVANATLASLFAACWSANAS
jgi:hypothetical protein